MLNGKMATKKCHCRKKEEIFVTHDSLLSSTSNKIVAFFCGKERL